MGIFDIFKGKKAKNIDSNLTNLFFKSNEACYEFNHTDAKDLMKLLFFNDPIPMLHTHNYGFHTATGRHIIETTKDYYYEFKNN